MREFVRAALSRLNKEEEVDGIRNEIYKNKTPLNVDQLERFMLANAKSNFLFCLSHPFALVAPKTVPCWAHEIMRQRQPATKNTCDIEIKNSLAISDGIKRAIVFGMFSVLNINVTQNERRRFFFLRLRLLLTHFAPYATRHLRERSRREDIPNARHISQSRKIKIISLSL